MKRRSPSIKALALTQIALVVGLAACSEEATKPLTGPLRGELSVDIRERATITITEKDAKTTEIKLSLTSGFGVAPTAVEMVGAGRIEPMPEAGLTLYTARFDAPADPAGPCGQSPISLALSLQRRGDAPRFSGSLAAYCGAGVWHGNPARLLRLAGDLKR